MTNEVGRMKGLTSKQQQLYQDESIQMRLKRRIIYFSVNPDQNHWFVKYHREQREKLMKKRKVRKYGTNIKRKADLVSIW